MTHSSPGSTRHAESPTQAAAKARPATGRIAAALALLAAAALLLAGCSGEEAAATRSIEEIHEEDGVPVQVRRVDRAEFRTYHSFTATLSGASESTASAMLSDEVAGVLYEVGEYVEQDAPVVLFPPDNPSLNYEQARVSFESARTAFERVQRLYEEDGVSQQAYDDARTQFELARANWESVQNMARVKAPISGYITRINVFESDNVAPGDPLFTVSDYDRLKSTVWLTDRQLASVTVGQPARAVWQDMEITGEVVQVDMAMDQRRKAFAAKLEFDNPNRAVMSGVTAEVEIDTYRSNEALILNQREIVDDGTGQSVFVARDGEAVAVPVSIGRRQGLLVEIASGLSPGDEVITRGIELVSDGDAVRIVEREDRLVQR